MVVVKIGIAVDMTSVSIVDVPRDIMRHDVDVPVRMPTAKRSPMS